MEDTSGLNFQLFDMENMDRPYSGIFDEENIGGLYSRIFDMENIGELHSEFIDTEDISGLYLDFMNDMPAGPQATDNISQFAQAMNQSATNDISQIAQNVPQSTEPLEFPGSMKPTARTRKPKAPTLRESNWEPHKARIIELHIKEKRPLPEVKLVIEQEYGFTAEIRQYRARISQWKLDKNIKADEMKCIVRKRQRRKLVEVDKHDLKFRVRGREVELQKIERWMKRHDVPASMTYSPSPPAPTPSAVSCRTISELSSPCPSPANTRPLPLTPLAQDSTRGLPDISSPHVGLNSSGGELVATSILSLTPDSGFLYTFGSWLKKRLPTRPVLDAPATLDGYRWPQPWSSREEFVAERLATSISQHLLEGVPRTHQSISRGAHTTVYFPDYRSRTRLMTFFPTEPHWDWIWEQKKSRIHDVDDVEYSVINFHDSVVADSNIAGYIGDVSVFPWLALSVAFQFQFESGWMQSIVARRGESESVPSFAVYVIRAPLAIAISEL